MLENYVYLIVRTWSTGRVSVMASSNSKASAEAEYLYFLKAFKEDIEAGLFRIDLYSEGV